MVQEREGPGARVGGAESRWTSLVPGTDEKGLQRYRAPGYSGTGAPIRAQGRPQKMWI